MLSTLKTKSICRNLLLLFTLSIFFSCQKDLSLEGGVTVVTPPDLTTKVSSSVSGFVTDENDAAIMGASVQFGTSSITTDKYGYFEAKNISVVKEAAVVTVTKPGYFKGIKTYMAKEGKAAFFRIKLIPKTIVGNINAASGGTVTLANGLSIKLPAGGIVNAATNTAYTGTVNIAAYWINPEAADLNKIMPGDLRGINTVGALKLLQTFGMAAVELTGASGELLQVANGQKATLTLPIPSSLAASAPATIPLWYFDEAKGLWKQEGSATKAGNTYVGDVSHFSFWNWDVPGNYVMFDCTVKDATGNPIPFISVKITVVGTTNSRYAFTDAAGYVGGLVPANSNLVLEIFALYGCTTPVYSQAFTTTNVNVSLGVITITANYTAIVSGSVTDCSNSPVTNGYIIMLNSGQYTWYPLSNTGTFNFSTTLCNNNIAVTLIAEDITAMQQSNPQNTSLVAGPNVIGNLQACNNSIAEFLNYSVNGTTYSFTAPVDSVTFYGANSGSILYVIGSTIGGTYNAANITFNGTGIGLNSIQQLSNFEATHLPMSSIPNPILVNITEYGAIGQFISGNFSGTFVEFAPPNTVYNVTCNFRTRRTF